MRTVPCAREGHPPVVFDDRLRDFRHGEHKIHQTRHDGVSRHAAIAGLIRVLRDYQPAAFLDRFQPKASVRPRSRKDHADGKLAVLFRQSVQQKVEGQAGAVTRLGLREVQDAISNRKIRSRWDDIKMLPLYEHSVSRLPHGHGRVAGQQVHHHALVARIEMLDQNEGHAVTYRQRVHKLAAGIEASCRSAYTNDREVLGATRESAWRRRPLVRFKLGRLSLIWSNFRHLLRSL
jgi:hypothetical protein